MRLKQGDTIGIVSQSWCGPEVFPFVHEKGVENLEKMGFLVKEFPFTRKQGTPEQRAADVTAAFLDPEVKAVFCSIGGDDCTFLLEHLDVALLAKHKKPFMGYSDPTALHVVFSQHGIPCYYGPTTMAGLAQLDEYPEWFDYVERTLKGEILALKPFPEFSDGYEDWGTKVLKVKNKRENTGFHFLTTHTGEGKLFGGCMEVLEFLKGTKYWPAQDFWADKILFFETSEDVPSVTQVKYFLRNYGWMGVLQQVQGIIFGRARGYTDEEKAALETLLKQISEEFKLWIPIVANVDVGHTDPQFILPYGAKVRITKDSIAFTDRS